MRNLVDQIAQEAGIKRRHNDPTELWCWERDLQKFAELIVQECMSVCYEQAECAKHSFTPKRAELVEMTLRNIALLIENKTHEKVRQSCPQRNPK